MEKNVLAPVGITAAASPIDAEIKKNTWVWGKTVVISNEEINGIIQIVQAFEESNILLKRVTKTIENDTKHKKEDFQ